MDLMLNNQYGGPSPMPPHNHQGYPHLDRQQEQEDAQTLALATSKNTYWSNAVHSVSPNLEAIGLVSAVQQINGRKFETAVKIYIALKSNGSAKAIDRLTSRLDKEYFPTILDCLIKEADKAHKRLNLTFRSDDEGLPPMLDKLIEDADNTGRGFDAAFRLLGAIYKHNGEYNSKVYDAFMRADRNGSPTARYYLGHIHEEGLGVNKDNARALCYYRQ